MNTDEIKQTIPHRPPFLFVDEIVEATERRIVGRRIVRPDEYFFAGHFPGDPIMPGVLIVEAIAQTGAIMIMQKYKGMTPLFMGIDRTRFRKIVRPGDILVIEVELVHDRGTVAKMSGTARVNNEVVCETEILAGIKK